MSGQSVARWVGIGMLVLGCAAIGARGTEAEQGANAAPAFLEAHGHILSVDQSHRTFLLEQQPGVERMEFTIEDATVITKNGAALPSTELQAGMEPVVVRYLTQGDTHVARAITLASNGSQPFSTAMETPRPQGYAPVTTSGR